MYLQNLSIASFLRLLDTISNVHLNNLLLLLESLNTVL
jgi:hypothetical protein